MEIVPRNVAHGVRVVAAKAERVSTAWTPVEVVRFLEAAQDHRLYALFYCMITLGLRRGETLGLRWKDVDLEAGTLRVEQALVMVGSKPTFSKPKTLNSTRSIHLPSDVVVVLRGWKALQSRERADLDGAWQDTGLVFTSELGTLYRPDNLRRTFRDLCAKAKVSTIRVHDLRHSYASLALRRGIPVEVVSERLGHSNPAFTLTVYRHVLEDESKGYALSLSDLLSGKERAQA